MTFRQKLKNFSASLQDRLAPTTLARKSPIWREFLAEKVPVLLLIGPVYSGKTSLAHFLAENSNFRLLPLKRLSPQQPHQSATELERVIPFLREEIQNSFKFCSGFIVDDFPPKMREFRRFEREIVEPSMVVCTEISLDGTLGRALVQNPTVDLNKVRIQYVKDVKFADKVVQKYAKKKRALKILSQYPLQDVYSKVVDVMEAEFPNKFRQINKT